MLLLQTTFALILAFDIVFGNSIHSSHHDVSSEVHENSFALHGTDTKFLKFEIIPTDITKDLIELTLEYVEFDPDVLVKSIAECKNLKRIILHDVEWVGNFKARAMLPRLEEFSMFRTRGLHNIDEETLKQILFFDKETSWKLSEIHRQKVDIHTESISIDHETGSVYASVEFLNDVMKSMARDPVFHIKNLVLEHMIVSLNVFPSTLEFLMLHNVELEGNSTFDNLFQKTKQLKELDIGSMHEVLDLSDLPAESLESITLNNVHVIQSYPKQFTKLKNLTVVTCHLDPSFIPETIKSLELDDTFIYEGKINEIFAKTKGLEKLTLKRSTPSRIDVSFLPMETLKELHVENMNLELSDPSNVKSFPSLKIFTCQDCSIDSNIVQNFQTLFKHVEYFDLWFRSMETPVHQLLNAMIQGTKARRIEMLDFNRYIFDEKSKEDFNIAEKFLTQIGFPENDTVFVLEKISKNGSWRYTHPWDTDSDYNNHHGKPY